MNFYSSIVNQNYVLRGLSLFRSLEPFLVKEKFLLFCIDNASYQILKKFSCKKLKIIKTSEVFPSKIEELKKIRKPSEYCWTLKPYVVRYILKKFSNAQWVVYTDADAMFFSDLKKILKNEYDIVLTPHRFSNEVFKKQTIKVGKFNAGFIAFKRSQNSFMALDWWAERCYNHCSEYAENGLYADQKYLDEFPKKFKKVNNFPFSGVNIAPWNITNDFNVLRFRKEKLSTLIFYHMQGLKIYNKYIYKIYSENFKVDKETYKLIYLPYIRLLRKTYEDLKKLDVKFCQKKEFNINLKFLIKNYLTKNNNLKIIF